MTVLRQALAVAAKDLRIETRARHAVSSVLPFAATVLLAFGLSLGPGRLFLERTAPALLWLAVLFSAVLSSRQAYQVEAEDGALEGLVLAPIDRAALFLGKTAAVTVALLGLEVVVAVMVALLFDVALAGSPLLLLGAAVLGTVGLAAVGALFGVLATSARTREALLPLLVLPLVTPALMGAIRATELASAGGGSEAASWLGLLLAFDAVVVAVGTMVYGHLVED